MGEIIHLPKQGWYPALPMGVLATGLIVLGLLLLAVGLICDAMAKALVEAKHLT